MLKAFPFGEFAPDLAPSNSPHLTIAKNVYPILNGYAPVKALQEITDTLGGTFLGGAMFVDTDGDLFLFAGKEGILWLWDGSAWNVVASPSTPHLNYRFAQFGRNILLANGADLVLFDMSVGGTFNAVAVGAPTNNIDVARVRDFVMVLRDDQTIQWSQFNDAATWTVGINQADFQPLLSGGAGVGLVGGEYGIVLQTNALKRISYVGEPNGVDIIFQFDDISQEVGCMAQGSICNVGRLIFFLSERGFMMCDGENVVPIADEKINRWFFSTYSRTEIARMFSAIDPQRSLAMWSMPGNPGRIIMYNWVLKRWAWIEMSVDGIFSGFTSPTSLEDVDTLYPSGLDSVPVSLDDPSLNGGNPQLLVVSSEQKVGALTGANLAAEFKLENIELAPGRRSRVRAIRPVTDALNASATLNSRMRAGDTENIESCASMRASGKMPVRANGRYHNLDLVIPAGEDWSYVQGCEFEFEPGDNR